MKSPIDEDAVVYVEDHPDWIPHAHHGGGVFDPECSFCPDREDQPDNHELPGQDYPGGGVPHHGVLRRHAPMVVIAVICSLGVLSSMSPTVTRVLDAAALVAVLIAALGVAVLFSYLAVTSARGTLGGRDEHP